MGGVALRFCLVLGRSLMVVCCCGSGGHGMYLEASLLVVALAVSLLLLGLQNVREFSWVVWRCVSVWFWGGF